MTAPNHPRTLTTGQIARLLAVAPRTVSQWCDNGELPCWRLPPGRQTRQRRHAGDRRVLYGDLLNFMDRFGFPREILDDSPAQPCCFLFAGEPLSTRLAELLAGVPLTIASACTPFAAGAASAARRPDLAVLDCHQGRGESLVLARSLQRGGAIPLVALAGEDEDEMSALLAVTGDVIQHPFDPALLAERILSLLEGRSA